MLMFSTALNVVWGSNLKEKDQPIFAASGYKDFVSRACVFAIQVIIPHAARHEPPVHSSQPS